MAVLGVFTTEGLEKAQGSRDFAGWKIVPLTFAISDQKGVISTTRTTNSIFPIWASGDIEDHYDIDQGVLSITLRIPPGVPTNPEGKEIGEVYIFGRDHFGSSYLLGIAQVVDRSSVIKKTNDRIEIQLTLVIRRKEDIGKVQVKYNYDLGFSTTSAQDIMSLLEAGDNVNLSYFRNQVQVDIISPWGSIAHDSPHAGAEWNRVLRLDTTVNDNDSTFQIRAQGSISSFGGGCSIRLIAYSNGQRSAAVTLERRDYVDAIDSEVFEFVLDLEPPGTTVEMSFELEYFASPNINVIVSNETIERLDVVGTIGE